MARLEKCPPKAMVFPAAADSARDSESSFGLLGSKLNSLL
jgi:hypothetical protein